MAQHDPGHGHGPDAVDAVDVLGVAPGAHQLLPVGVGGEAEQEPHPQALLAVLLEGHVDAGADDEEQAKDADDNPRKGFISLFASRLVVMTDL